ncbi:MAG: M42 family metallopeptidase [Chloroflexia bacterium]|nr:M42 family metallopeptidase [Chloroflexia bacterium]
MQEILKQLSEQYGPSGNEEAVRQDLQALVADYAQETRVDALGNLIVRAKAGSAGGQRIMLAAHMDEIGLIVSYIDKKGFLRFTAVGGVNPLTLLGQRVRFASGLLGGIGIEPIESKNELAMNKLFIDVGAKDRAEAETMVRVGDVACMDRSFYLNNGRTIGKAMDDRAGCAILVETLRQLPSSPHDIYVVFTTQEEIGLRGATTSAYAIEPDMAIALDVTCTGDTPEAQPMAVSLGEGPAIKVKDSGMLAHPGVKDLLIRTAEAHDIPYQREVLLGGTTDSRAIQTSRAGVPAGTISIAARYVHTTSEMIDVEDLHNSVRLLLALLQGPIDL